MRRPAERARLVRLLRPALDGGERVAVRLVHPGSLPVAVFDALAAALPAHASLAVADLDRLPRYWEAAMRPGAEDPGIDELADCVAAALPAPARGARVVLAGWSFGGAVAHALAVRGGDPPPERVLALDSLAPAGALPAYDAVGDEMLLAWFAMYLAAKRNAGRPLLPVAAFAGMTPEEGLETIRVAAIAAGACHPATEHAGLAKLFETFLAGFRRSRRIMARYDARPCPVPLDVVKPAGTLMPELDALGWDRVGATALTVHRCAGDHYTMLTEPSAVALVAALAAGAHDPAGALGAPLPS